MSHDLRGGAGRSRDCQPGRALQMRCLECGVETAEVTPACAVCGAPAPRQSAASAWSGLRAWVQRYPVRQRRSRAKLHPAPRANGPAPPGATADPPDSDPEGWIAATAISASGGQKSPKAAPDPKVDGAILAEWIQATKFSTIRLRPGYNQEEVDAFLDAIRDTFLGIRAPSLTPDEIRNIQFSTTRLRPGYDEEEVDDFLDEAGSKLAARAGDRADATRQRSVVPDPAADAVQIRCLECGAESAEATEVCARCGASTSYQSSAADPAVAESAPFSTAPCNQPHTDEVFFAGNAWPRSLAYPGDPRVYVEGYTRCLTAFTAYDGIDNSMSAFDIVASTPDSTTWPAGDRRLVCFADAGGSVNFSIRGSNQ
jgi:DivIVA domain-containing protein